MFWTAGSRAGEGREQGPDGEGRGRAAADHRGCGRVFEDAFPVDHILTNATIYWVNQAIGSSIRAYKNANLYPWTPSHDRQPPIEAPAGFTLLLGDASPPGGHTPEDRIAAFKAGGGRFYGDVRNVNVHQEGGHFGPWENPDVWIHDLRATYRPLRSRRGSEAARLAS